MNKLKTKTQAPSPSSKILPNLIAGLTLFILSIFVLASATFGNSAQAQQGSGFNNAPGANNTPGNVAPGPVNNLPAKTQANNSGGLVTLRSPLKKVSVDELLDLAVKLAVRIGTVLSVLALMYVGFQFIVARGSEGKITAAKEHLWYVIIGIAVLFGATLIVEIIKVTLSPFVDTTNLGAKP